MDYRLLGTIAHREILRKRPRVEEAVLLADPVYREVMGSEPKFLPRLF